MFSGCSESGDRTESDALTIFAAASTTDVLTELAERFEQEHDVVVRSSFDASSTLARQITTGAPADLYLSADPAWMDWVEREGLIEPETRFDLVANRLVLIVPGEARPAGQVDRGDSLSEVVPDLERLAIGDPSHVPAGQYAREALQWLGWWDEAFPRVIPALDVRGALRLVEMGEADAGIVYATDAAASDLVSVLAVLPAQSHTPVRYPVAACQGSDERTDAFLLFLRSPTAVETFERHGFEVIPIASDTP